MRGIDNAESVADHSWGTAMLCRIYAASAEVNPTDAMAMALLHDLAESETGDIPYAPQGRAISEERANKAQAEAAEMSRLLGRNSTIPGADTLLDLWEEYEHSRTRTALFVRDMNLVDMALQALLYHTQERTEESGLKMLEFVDSARARVRTDVGRRLTDEIKTEIHNLRDSAPEYTRRTQESD